MHVKTNLAAQRKSAADLEDLQMTVNILRHRQCPALLCAAKSLVTSIVELSFMIHPRHEVLDPVYLMDIH